MPRILGVDYGRRRIGVAISDDLDVTAQGLPTIESTGRADAVTQVAALAEVRSATKIVVGLPLNMDGSRGDLARAAEAFARALEPAAGIPVSLWDERLTSQAARRLLQDTGTSTRGNKGAVDRIAACLLLDSYLASLPSTDR